jgi:cellobiose transport system substrate-binding protein
VTRRRLGAAVAVAASVALIMSGCSSTGGGTTSNEPITLTITTFGTMGLDSVYKDYEKLHPNITIKANNIDSGGNAKTDAFTKLAAGSGLSDIVAVEQGWMASVLDVSDQFQDLSDYGIDKVKDQWLDWKLAAGTDTKGRIVGAGLDIGPIGLCFNGPLLKAAGMPSDRAGVAELLGGADATWEKYFEVGKQYHAATGKPWYDGSQITWQVMTDQLPVGYYSGPGKIDVEGNTALRDRWNLVADGAKSGLSAKLTAWDWGGGKAFADGSFATFACPSWMLGIVKNNSEANGGSASTGWDFADVFPGGPANWGGSFLVVPKQSKHPQEAADLALWLSAPKQTVTEFKASGVFPSTTAGLADPALKVQGDLDKFFQNAPLGEILSKRAVGIKSQYKGPDAGLISDQVFGPAAQELDKGVSGDKAWQDALDLLKKLVTDK